MRRPSTAPLRSAWAWLKHWFSGYPGWVGGVLAGLQAALGPYLAVSILAMAVIAADPGPTAGDGIPWGSAFTVATTVFLMAHGVPAVTSIGTITLLPLGLTLLSAAAMVGLARRFATRTWTSWTLAVVSYVVIVGVIGAVALGGRPDGGSLIVRACTVAALIAAPAAAAGIWRAHGAEFSWMTQLPAWSLRGVRRGTAALAVAFALASVVALVFVVVGRASVADAATGLGVDGVGGIVLAIGELAYAPTFIVWMLAWLTGQGFSVGVGSAYAPGELAQAALPEIPLLGALPAHAGGWLVWAPWSLVAIGVLVRVATRRRGALGWDEAKADAVALAVVTGGGIAAFAMASGAMGPGRLASAVGVDLVPAVTALAGLVLAGLLLGTGAIALKDVVVRRRSGAAAPPEGRERASSDASAPVEPEGATTPS
ncbi:MAG: DUF6350 family protein [Demequina sp.]|uniref:cell division protein PerM n=1 Tax=Demequina sp. TaxID=2050685 RepID=UPI003A8B2347